MSSDGSSDRWSPSSSTRVDGQLAKNCGLSRGTHCGRNKKKKAECWPCPLSLHTLQCLLQRSPLDRTQPEAKGQRHPPVPSVCTRFQGQNRTGKVRPCTGGHRHDLENGHVLPSIETEAGRRRQIFNLVCFSPQPCRVLTLF